jgi:hypothetical protein
MITDFTQTPAYQRMRQKLLTIRPEQRAVLNTLSMDEQFADAATRRNLAAMAQANNKDYANKSLDLRSKELASNVGLRERELAQRGDLGTRQLTQSVDVGNRRIGLQRRQFEEGKDQDRMATGLGLGQVIAEADYGQRRDAIDLELLKKRMAFGNRLNKLYAGGE